jgi:hypothetical protein
MQIWLRTCSALAFVVGEWNSLASAEVMPAPPKPANAELVWSFEDGKDIWQAGELTDQAFTGRAALRAVPAPGEAAHGPYVMTAWKDAGLGAIPSNPTLNLAVWTPKATALKIVCECGDREPELVLTTKGGGWEYVSLLLRGFAGAPTPLAGATLMRLRIALNARNDSGPLCVDDVSISDRPVRSPYEKDAPPPAAVNILRAFSMCPTKDSIIVCWEADQEGDATVAYGVGESSDRKAAAELYAIHPSRTMSNGPAASWRPAERDGKWRWVTTRASTWAGTARSGDTCAATPGFFKSTAWTCTSAATRISTSVSSRSVPGTTTTRAS